MSQGPIRSNRKHARGILVSMEPAFQSQFLVNGVDYRIRIADQGPLPSQYGIQEFLDLLPKASYRFRVVGGGNGSLISLIPRMIFNLFRKFSGPQVLRSIRLKYPSIGNSDRRKPNPKRPGGPKSRARYQKSYR